VEIDAIYHDSLLNRRRMKFNYIENADGYQYPQAWIEAKSYTLYTDDMKDVQNH